MYEYIFCLLSNRFHNVSPPPKTILLPKFPNAIVSKSKYRVNVRRSELRLPSCDAGMAYHAVQRTMFSIHVDCVFV